MNNSSGSLPLYYAGKSLADMEAMLQNGYLTSSGWLESAENKLAVRSGKPIPWFTYAALGFLENELTAEVSIFEYGGGQSTLYWAERVNRVVAIDHDSAFVSHVSRTLPQNAAIHLVEEGDSRTRAVSGLPVLIDPPRDPRTYRSGQLNKAFQDYALKLLEYQANQFDVVIIDGMARVLSTWAALHHFRRGGFIVFDNSDREFYQPAYDMLERAGYRRMARFKSKCNTYRERMLHGKTLQTYHPGRAHVDSNPTPAGIQSCCYSGKSGATSFLCYS